MKTTLHRLIFAIVIATSTVGCTTAYDRYGRPYEVVEPGAAVVGAAAVGLLAYGLAESHHHSYRDGGYYSRGCYQQPYRSNYYSGYNRGYYSGYNHGYCGY